MQKNKTHTTIYLSGMEFRITVPESEEYMQKLAVFVNKRIDDTHRRYPSLSSGECALFAMFDLANDYHNLTDAYNRLESNISTIRESRTRLEHERTRTAAPVKRPFEKVSTE